MNPLEQYISLRKIFEPDDNPELVSDKALLIGALSQLILNKKVFKRNKELETFLKDVFQVTFLEYVLKSRTLILAKVIRIVTDADEEKTFYYINQFNDFIHKILTNSEADDEKEKSKKYFEYWRKVIDEYEN